MTERFNLAQWNFIGGIQFKHVKVAQRSCSAMTEYVMNRPWTLFLLYVIMLNCLACAFRRKERKKRLFNLIKPSRYQISPKFLHFITYSNRFGQPH